MDVCIAMCVPVGARATFYMYKCISMYRYIYIDMHARLYKQIDNIVFTVSIDMIINMYVDTHVCIYLSIYMRGWLGGRVRVGGRAGRAGGWVGCGRRARRSGGRTGGWVGGLDAAGGRVRGCWVGCGSWARRVGGRAGGQVGGWGLAMLSKWTRTHPSHSSVAISGSCFEGSRAHRSKKGCFERSRHAMAKQKKKKKPSAASMRSASNAADRKARAWESAAGFVGASFVSAQVIAVEMIDEMLEVMAVVGLPAFVNEHLSAEIRARQKVNITTERRVSKNDLAPNGP
jgi:hypothetical protein